MKLSESINAYISDTTLTVGNVYEKHCHTEYELIYLLNGSVLINLEGEKILLTEKDAILISPLSYHIVSGRGTAYRRLIMRFSVEDVPAEIRPLLEKGAKASPVNRDAQLSKLLARLADVLENGDEIYRPLAYAWLTESLYFFIHPDHAKQRNEPKSTGMIKETIAYIDAHLDRNVTVRELASLLYCSESTLNHVFKKEMNIPIKQYVIDKRIAYAKAKLENGIPPLECATLCGYRNYPAFYKIFVKNTGLSPSGYATKSQKDLDNVADDVII